MVKDMLSQIQQISVKLGKDVDECEDVANDSDDEYDTSDDVIDVCDRALKLGEGVAGQVNILASASQRLLEGDTQKQVNWYLAILCDKYS